jgi:hypothetical protein
MQITSTWCTNKKVVHWCARAICGLKDLDKADELKTYRMRYKESACRGITSYVVQGDLVMRCAGGVVADAAVALGQGKMRRKVTVPIAVW